jgi:hypothetical protein
MVKLDEGIFHFSPKESYLPREIIENLAGNEDFIKYCKQYFGEELQVNIKVKVDSNSKSSLYEYYHKVTLGMAIICFTDQGWGPVDKVKADYLLKNECAKTEIYNEKTGELIITTEDKANMPKPRLYKYITDCNLFLEEMGYPVPEAIRMSHPGYTKANTFKK